MFDFTVDTSSDDIRDTTSASLGIYRVYFNNSAQGFDMLAGVFLDGVVVRSGFTQHYDGPNLRRFDTDSSKV